MKVSYLLFSYFFILYFSRLLVTVGFPTIFNLLHFVFIGIIFTLVLFHFRKSYDKRLKILILIFLMINLFSSFLNTTSILASLISFIILMEPYMLLYILFYTKKYYNKFYNLFIVIFMLNILFVLIQNKIFHNHDYIQGIFINMGNGAHVLGGISMVTVILYFIKSKSVYIKILISILAFYITLAADAKQVVAVFFIATLGLIFINTKITTKIKVLVILLGFLLMLDNIKLLLPNYGVWIEQGYFIIIDGFTLKYHIFIELYNRGDLLNMFLGFGPGQTVSRLAMMTPDYAFFSQLGMADNGLYNDIWNLQQSNYLTNTRTGSSMFTLMFSWAGLYGDLGLIGLLNYLGILVHIYYKYTPTIISKYILIVLFLFGSISLWFGESTFMVAVMFTLSYIVHQLHSFTGESTNVNK